MSQEYDVFAELYENDKDDKVKFMEILKSRHNNDLESNDSSDEDLFLPPNLQSKNKGRGKNAKSPPKKNDPPKKSESKNNKTKAAQAPNTKQQQQTTTTTNETPQPSAKNLPTTSNVAPNRRSTRSSTSNASQVVTRSPNPAAAFGGPARGKRSRRGRNNDALSIPALGIDNTMTFMETMDVFRTMMGGRTRRSVMRARRTYFAEMAARSTNVDYVDLVSSPMPQISGVVTVDSDADDSKSSNSVEVTSTEESQNTAVNNSLECSFDEDNPEISVKIKWDGGSPEIFKLRKYQKFYDIFNEIANRENISFENLVFNIDNRIISANDTPASVNYKIYEFISGRALTDLYDIGIVRKKRDVNIISLKIQSDLWPKKPLKVELNKTDKLKILYIKCSEELKMAPEDLILSFNGDHLGFNDTPEDFELENDEAVDLRLKKK